MSEEDRWLARSLSIQQWEFLCDHFEGMRPILNNDCSDRMRMAQESRTRIALIRMEMITQLPYPIPKFTQLTERGHRAMCAALGLMADMLVANGYIGEKRPDDEAKRKTLAYGRIAHDRQAADR